MSIFVSNVIQAQTCNAPVINSFTPNTGFIGSTVTITGANFDAIPANNQVYFGATKANIISASFGTLVVAVPTGANVAPIAVKNACNKIGYSSVAFNGIFCPTPITSTTYQNTAFQLNGVYGAYNMIAQDMDLDGKPDVISMPQGGAVTVARNNSTPGNLNFVAHNFPYGGQSVAVADFDGDGLRDIRYPGAVIRNTSTGPGNINFAAPVSAGPGGYQTAVGDFNNDGKVDVVVETGGTVYVTLNTSTGPGNISFGAIVSAGYVSTTCTGLQAADVDGDGKTDILGSQGGLNRAVTIRNTTIPGASTFTFEAPEYWASNGSYPYRCQIADFNKDGKIDLTTCNYQGATNTAIYINNSTVGNISFLTTINLPAPSANYRIGVGDVNGDGYPDIVTKSLGVNVFSVYPNTSTSASSVSFGARFDYSSSTQAEVSGIVIGDLDGDFVPDIATSGINSNNIRFHRNTSSQVDNLAPNAVCKNITVALSPTGTAVVTAAMIDNGSGDACGLGSIKIDGAASKTFTCADIGANTVTLTVTDIAGNSTTCNAVVTVAPAAIIVAGQTTVCQGQTIPMVANLGDSYQWYNNGVLLAGETNQQYIATVSGNYTVAVTNAGGCSGTSSATTVVVNNNPTVSTSPSGAASLCPPSGTLTITASVSSIYQWQKNGVNIPNATQQTLTVNSVGTYTVNVIDLFGCSATSAPVVVGSVDNVNPVLVTNNITVALDANETATANLTSLVNAYSDNCSNVSLSLSGQTSYSCSDIGNTIPVSITTTDGSGNTTTQIALVTVTDPNSYCVPNITIQASNDLVCPGTPVTITANATSNSNLSSTPATLNTAGLVANWKFDETSGSTIIDNSSNNLGGSFVGSVGRVSSSAFAGAGNALSFNGGQFVQVNDNAAINSMQNNLTIEAWIYQTDNNNNTIIDRANYNFLFEINPNGAPGLGFYNPNHGWSYSTTSIPVNQWVHVAVTWDNATHSLKFYKNGVLTDNFNKPNSLFFNAGPINIGRQEPNGCQCNIMNGQIDDLRLWNTTRSQAEIQSNMSVLPPQVSYTYNWTNSSGLNASGAVLNVNPSTTTTYNLSVQGSNGSVGTSSQTITVSDTENPVALVQNLTRTLTTASGPVTITASDINNGSTDNCSIASLTIVGNSTFDCSTVSGTYPVTLLVTDGSGNTSTNISSITIINECNNPPVAVCQNLTVGADGVTAIVDASAFNNGSSDPDGDVITYSVSPAGPYALGTTNVVLTVSDPAGLTSTCTASITVNDVTAPTMSVKNATVYLDANGNGSITVADIDNGSTDNVGIVSNVLSNTSYNCSNLGANSVTLTATDAAGNSSSANATVSVIDAIAPIAIAQNYSVNLDANGTASISVADINNGSTDNCSVASISLDNTSFNCSNLGANTVTLTVVDGSGNSSTATATVTVNDVTAPTALVKNLVVQLDANGMASVSASQFNDGSFDNCSIADMSVTQTSFNCTNVGVNTLTFTITDGSGNSSSALVTVLVQDVTAPIITASADQVFCEESNGTYTIQNITATDNCAVTTTFTTITGATSRFSPGLDASGVFAVGTSTVTWTVMDAQQNTSTSSITVTINPAPVASITSTTADALCNEITLTAGSTNAGPYNYAWSTGETTQSISLGLADADGIYTVYVTDANGCNSLTPASYNFQKQTLASSYTILANNEVELKGTNIVQSGSVGVMKVNGEAEFEKGVTVTGVGSFTKSPKYKTKGTVTITNKITGVANVLLPTMQSYTGSTNSLPSYSVNKNTTVTLNSNYKDLTVKKGANATINGSVFRKVTIEEGATVKFTSAVVNIEDLSIGKGSSSTVRVRFAGNTSIRIKDKVKIEGNAIINQDNYQVTFYFASTSGCNEGDEDKFSVKGGNTTVNANVLIPGGKIKVENEGDDDDDDDCHGHGNNNGGTSIYMKGLFVGNTVKGDGKNIYWNTFNCVASANRDVIVELTPSVVEESLLNLLVYPNPALSTFNFKLETMSEEKVSFRIFDVAGRLVFENTDANPNESYNIGESLTPGVYMVDATQGSERKVLRVVKTL